MKNNIEKVYGKLPKKKLGLKKHKIDLAVGNELSSLEEQVVSLSQKFDDNVGLAYDPLRQVEKIVEELPDEINGFQEFLNALQQLEEQYLKDEQKVRDFENELGVKIDRPEALNVALKTLELYQNLEEIGRQSINEYQEYANQLRGFRVV
jgi:vacuolar-type H+-ATPase subunit I/STV1